MENIIKALWNWILLKILAGHNVIQIPNNFHNYKHQNSFIASYQKLNTIRLTLLLIIRTIQLRHSPYFIYIYFFKLYNITTFDNTIAPQKQLIPFNSLFYLHLLKCFPRYTSFNSYSPYSVINTPGIDKCYNFINLNCISLGLSMCLSNNLIYFYLIKAFQQVQMMTFIVYFLELISLVIYWCASQYQCRLVGFSIIILSIFQSRFYICFYLRALYTSSGFIWKRFYTIIS